MGDRGDSCKLIPEPSSSGFPGYECIGGDPEFPLIDPCPELPDDTGLLQAPDPLHHVALGEVKAFSYLGKGGRDERETPFQFPEEGDIRIIHV